MYSDRGGKKKYFLKRISAGVVIALYAEDMGTVRKTFQPSISAGIVLMTFSCKRIWIR